MLNIYYFGHLVGAAGTDSIMRVVEIDICDFELEFMLVFDAILMLHQVF